MDPCSESAIKAVLKELTSEEKLDDDKSPQASAADWLINVDPEKVCADNRKQLVQRYALATFYYETEGDKWKFCSASDDSPCNDIDNIDDDGAKLPFLSEGSECDWYGVDCDLAQTGKVTMFRLKPCEYSILRIISIHNIWKTHISVLYY